MVVRILALLVVGFGAVACSEQKKLNEMHDSTLEMNDTTKDLLEVSTDMRETTGELLEVSNDMRTTTREVVEISTEMSTKMDGMATRTEEVARTSEELYDASRQGVSLQLRRDALDALLRAQSGGKKIEEAAAYFMSFEFQLWTGWGPDETTEKRDELASNAVAEFLKAVQEFTVRGDVEPFAESSGEAADLHREANKQASFNALSAALHQLNRKQEEMLARSPQFQPMSMWSLLTESLRLEGDVNEGRVDLAALKEYQREVLVNKELVVRLLQARHNFIPAIFLSKVIPQDRLRDRVRAGLNYYLNWGATWNLDLDRFNLTQLKEYSRYLEASLSTRRVLSDLGIEPRIDATLTAFMRGVRPQTEGKGGGEISAARVELVNLLEAHAP